MAAPWRKAFPGTWSPSEAAFTKPPGSLVKQAMLGDSAAAGASGSLAVTVPAPSATFTASVGFAGTLGLTTPAPAVTASARVTVSGSLSLTLPAPTLAASGSIGAAGLSGTMAVTVPGPAFAVSGAALSQGTLALTMPSPTASGSGSVTVSGVGTITPAGPVFAGSGAAAFSGTLSLAAPAPTFTGAGSMGPSEVTGTIGITLDTPAFAGSGSVAVTGGLAGALPSPVFDAQGAILTPLVGTLDATLGDPVFAAQGSSGAVILQGYSVTPKIKPPEPEIQGQLAASLPGPAFRGEGKIEPASDPVQPLLNPVQSPAYTRPIEPVQETSEPIQVSAPEPITASMSVALDGPILESIGQTLQVGSLAASLDAPTFQAQGEAQAFDDTEEIALALMLLEAA